MALVGVLPGTSLAYEEPTTISYDVGDIAAKKRSWERVRLTRMSGEAMPGQSEDALEGLSRVLLKLLIQDKPARAKKFLGKDAPYRIEISNRGELEIRADRKTHEEVKDLLAALRRSLDVAVVVNCQLYEVDREVYDKQLAGKWPRRPGSPAVFAYPAPDESEQKLIDGKLEDKPFWAGMKPLKTGKITLPDGVRGEILSWRLAVPYEKNPSRVFKKSEIAIAYPGFSFSITPVVSADRRSTRIKLTQKVADLLEWQKVKARQGLPNQETKDVLFEVPILQESSFTSTFSALDTWPVVAAVQWRKPGAQGKDSQLILVFSATIRIEAEEKERAVQEALEKKSKK